MVKEMKISGLTDKFIIGQTFKKLSLISCFLFLIKDITDEDKSKELLIEIKKLLQEKVNTNFKNQKISQKDTDINILEDITSSTIYFKDLDKTYYLFDRSIRINFSRNAKLFEYTNFLLKNYLDKRIKYIREKNKISNIVEELKTQVEEKKCNLVKAIINNNQNNMIYKDFFYDLFNNIDKINNVPITLISEILQTNIILIKDENIDNIIQNNKNYKYIILITKNKNYIPLYTKDKKVFYNDDEVIIKILSRFYKTKPIVNDNRLSKIIEEIQNTKTEKNDIKEYVSTLGLDEA